MEIAVDHGMTDEEREAYRHYQDFPPPKAGCYSKSMSRWDADDDDYDYDDNLESDGPAEFLKRYRAGEFTKKEAEKEKRLARLREIDRKKDELKKKVFEDKTLSMTEAADQLIKIMYLDGDDKGGAVEPLPTPSLVDWDKWTKEERDHVLLRIRNLWVMHRDVDYLREKMKARMTEADDDEQYKDDSLLYEIGSYPISRAGKARLRQMIIESRKNPRKLPI